MLRNLDKYKPSEKDGEYGGNSCVKEGLNIDGQNWLIKYPKNASYLARHAEMQYTNDTVSEYLGSQIYKILGYPVHETFLGERNGKIVVACRDFLNDNERLVEIRQLKNSANNEMLDLLERDFSSTSSSRIVNFEEVRLHLDHNKNIKDVPGIKERFYDQIVIDAFINNSDRNNGNWGIIRSKGTPDRLAPIFDNGGAFNGKTPDSRLEKMIDTPVLAKSAVDIVSIFGTEEDRFKVKDLLNLDIPELRMAIIKSVPLIQEHMQEIYNLIDSVDERACSDIRKNFYKQSLTVRYNEILVPAYEHAVSIEYPDQAIENEMGEENQETDGFSQDDED